MNNSIPLARLIVLSLILLVGSGVTAQTVTTLHDFGSRRDGENPQSGVVFDQAPTIKAVSSEPPPPGAAVLSRGESYFGSIPR